MAYRFKPDRPLVLGIMGGIASGKTAVAGLMAECGLLHIDADRLAREQAARPEVLSALRKAFPGELFRPDGQLDREAMAGLVFRDPEAKRNLEEVLHPPIRRAILSALEQARQRKQSVILDAPLLLEGGLIDHCDACIFVQADDAAREERVRARGWSQEELRQREENQAPLTVKIARSAFTISNSGPLPRTRERVIELLAQLEAKPPGNLGD